MTYEDLLLKAELLGLIVKEKPLKAYNGRIKGNKIAIKKDLSVTAKKCALIEEIGHHKTTVGNILDQSKIENRKQERFARAWGYENLINLVNLIDAKKAGVNNKFELSEYLNVEEKFLEDALKYFKEKYGKMCFVEDYIIEFEPLEVYERVDFNPNSKID